MTKYIKGTTTYTGNKNITLWSNMHHWVYFILGMLTATGIIIGLVMFISIVYGAEIKMSASVLPNPCNVAMEHAREVCGK